MEKIPIINSSKSITPAYADIITGRILDELNEEYLIQDPVTKDKEIVKGVSLSYLIRTLSARRQSNPIKGIGKDWQKLILTLEFKIVRARNVRYNHPCLIVTV